MTATAIIKSCPSITPNPYSPHFFSDVWTESNTFLYSKTGLMTSDMSKQMITAEEVCRGVSGATRFSYCPEEVWELLSETKPFGPPFSSYEWTKQKVRNASGSLQPQRGKPLCKAWGTSKERVTTWHALTLGCTFLESCLMGYCHFGTTVPKLFCYLLLPIVLVLKKNNCTITHKKQKAAAGQWRCDLKHL